jgi:HAD superfamily hydrolase (TIGR01509 family)
LSVPRPTQLVIFDCDGVLVDSEVICNRVLAQVVSELGWPQTVEESLERFKGLAMSDIWDAVGRHVGRTVSEDVNRDFRVRQLAALRESVQAVEGAREAIESLQVAYCVASNGPPEKMEATLGTTGLMPLFEGRMFSRVDVARPKPHPDLFLHAARSMAVEPAATLVVEDSPLGIEAARSAGMRALGFAGTEAADATALSEAGAEDVIEELRHVRRFL